MEEKVVTISLKNNIYQQIFDFPVDVIKFILSKANYNVVKKLYFTCKYFPSKFRVYLIDGLIWSKLSFLNDSKSYPATYEALESVDKIWFGECLRDGFLPLRKWTPKIEKCTIKTLVLMQGVLAWNDFKILAKNGTIEEFNVVEVIYSNREIVALEDICAYMPKVKKFELQFTHVTPKTMKEICKSHNISTKIKEFGIKNIDGLLNAEDFLEFLQKHCCNKGFFQIYFTAVVPKSEKRKFFSAVNSEKWSESKPYCYGFRC